MHDATNRLSHFKLAIAPGVPLSRLSKLLALQRAEEPEVTIAFFEVTGMTWWQDFVKAATTLECRFRAWPIHP